ncbi:hypothetical protein NADFUDRAFT_49829 [Nadsonia fulvescens var. elongata DSM 6958]|uniref:ABC transporter domain-containing protein n=1 Tax=Nadsonia fulvescens var. elongata DSM 6958 TaxID=857566 RepID=A0A1E3PRC7_9ASCO|nr:hypothetical protein NADFUDRAFT_49829 [Nadsonia fulvescens var. elongata DSM 6958]
MFDKVNDSINTVLISDCVWLGDKINPTSITKFSDQAYQLKWKTLLVDLKSVPGILVFQRIMFQDLKAFGSQGAFSVDDVGAKNSTLEYLVKNKALIKNFSGIEIDVTRNTSSYEPVSRKNFMVNLESMILAIENNFSKGFLIAIRLNPKDILLCQDILQSELMESLTYIHLMNTKDNVTIMANLSKKNSLLKGLNGDTFILGSPVLKSCRFYDIPSHTDTVDVLYLATHSSPLTLVQSYDKSSENMGLKTRGEADILDKACSGKLYHRTRPFSADTGILKSSASSDNVPTYFSNIANNLKPPRKISTSDSSSTRLWGYLILISTWSIFVFGMGSMLGVWEWVFFRGNTSTENREIYNTEEFPIKEYFPSLIFLMGVVAWAWCIVSWMAGIIAVCTIPALAGGSRIRGITNDVVGRALDNSPFAITPHKPLDDTCPPCFNCMLPKFTCNQFAECNPYNGRCDCPPGFGGDDCSEPVCGSLADGPNRAIREGSTCDCTNGWSGINCNMCSDDQSCNAFMPDGIPGTCYTGGLLVKNNYQMCDVTNQKILDILKGKIPQVTFTCNKTSSTCDFQFWVDQRESFYCSLDECAFEADMKSNTNITRYNCPNVQCQCIPDRMLCGEDGSIDISEFLTETIRGPGEFTCDSKTRKCKFSEPSMNDLISSVFGDPYISLKCDSSECLHYTEIPGYQPPVKTVDRNAVIIGLSGGALLVIIGYCLFKYLILADNDDTSKIALPSDDEDYKLINGTNPASLQFKDVSYSDNGKQILSGNIFGQVSPGQVLAIMGGSGAGKTTLLDILARKNKRGVIGGKICVNGQEYDDELYKSITGFVDQEDCLLPTLTVYETILTSALLRLPKKMSLAAKKLRVLETMDELGILAIKNRLIGDETKRGISGGEKRRVSIACELVTSPSIIFLDEPTSGLDSYNAFNVVENLVCLARNYNRTVVFTIHQPRSNIVQLFDNLILLCSGQQVYSGSSQDCAQFFSELGYQCPTGFNIADYLIDLTMEAAANYDPASKFLDDQVDQAPSSSSRNNSQDRMALDNDEVLHIDPVVRSDSDIDTTNEWLHYATHRDEGVIKPRKRMSIASFSGSGTTLEKLVDSYQSSVLAESIKAQIDLACTQNNDEEVNGTSKATLAPQFKRVGVFGQFLIISDRTFKNLYRDPLLLFAHYVMAIVLGLFCGVVYYQISDDISGFQNRLGVFFFLLSLFGFSTLTGLNMLFGAERLSFMRERSKGYYHPAAYYVAKVFFDIIPLRVFPPVLLSIIIYPLIGLREGGFMIFTLVLVLFNLAAASLCLLIGILFGGNASVANLVGCLAMLFSMLFAGLFVNRDTLSIWGIRDLQFFSIFHYAYEAISVNEVAKLTLTERKYGLNIEIPGATILSTFGFDNGKVMMDIVYLGGYIGILLLAGYIALHHILVELR